MSEGPSKRRKTNDGQSQVSDPRFANIHSDPRYRLPSKKQKVKLDSRFKTAFQGDAFVKRAKVDRYGRPVNDESAKRRLTQKFEIDSQEDSDEPDDDEEVQKELARAEQRHDPLRDGKLDISSSEEESSSEDEPDVDEDEGAADLEAEPNVPEGEVTRRIALVNLDWDNIRADDLMAVFSSFLPAGGHLSQVAVYPSEFGKERMDREEMEGPPKEIFAQAIDANDADMDEDEEFDDEEIQASVIKPDDGSEFDSQALRQYQLERLRYFYAVLTFSTKAAAKHIYDAVDGTEYLSTANFFDLRFVPDEMDFDDDKPRDVCTSLPSDYKPNEFVTDALQHSKVKLTWDQEDRGRKDAQARAFKGGQKEIDENDLKAYLGSDSSDNDDETANVQVMAESHVAATKSKKQLEREKARALLGFSIEPTRTAKTNKDGPVGDIQITFSSGLSSAANVDEKRRSVFENSPEPNETTAEKYVRKERERKQKRKEKQRAARSGGAVVENTEALEEDDVQDLGFDDPFFNDASLNDSTVKNKTRKEDRLKRKQEKQTQEAASAKQRAELELIMAEDEQAQSAAAGKGRAVQHFDMTEIEKTEKRKGKKDKYKKKHQPDKSILQDDFAMNVSDPRLGKLFDTHEFAIDPTNQKLKQTSGMKELIEESRRRKQNAGQTESTAPAKQKTKPPPQSETDALVAKIKRRAQ